VSEKGVDEEYVSNLSVTSMISQETLRLQDAATREERVPMARIATVVEKEMTTWRCIKAFRPAVLQAIILSCACIMEGFDLVLITGFLTNAAFRRKFQCPDAPDGALCVIPAAWESALVVGPTVGQMLGVLISGWMVERFGYKKTFMASLIALSGFIFIVFFAVSLPMFLVGLLLCGLPWGVFQTLTTNYASDVCPTPIRAYITAWSNVCWIIGQCLGAVVQRAMIKNQTILSISLPLGLQWVFPVPIFIFALWAQESPWWLVRHGRNEEARKALSKLVAMKHAPQGYTIDGQLAMIQLTNADELRETDGAGTGYLDCFKGANRRRTEISVATWIIQNACGSALMQWSPYFFQRAGMAPEQAWNFVIVQVSTPFCLLRAPLTLILYALGLIGTAVSWVLLNHFGRRTIELGGLCGLTLVLTICGTVAILPISTVTMGWAEGSLLLVYTLVYGCTIGPVTYALVSELSSTRTKSKTINIARMGYNAFGVFNCIITPYQLNETAWNWGGKTAWFWVAFCVICLIYAYFRIPEPRGRTYAEMDWLFTEGISARKFRSTVVPKFGDDNEIPTAKEGGLFAGPTPLATPALEKAIQLGDPSYLKTVDGAADVQSDRGAVAETGAIERVDTATAAQKHESITNIQTAHSQREADQQDQDLQTPRGAGGPEVVHRNTPQGLTPSNTARYPPIESDDDDDEMRPVSPRPTVIESIETGTRKKGWGWNPFARKEQ
jgi:SP family general alpha glucoside:H+ symporter-like MFS transporter